MNLAYILKDSNYKLSQFTSEEIDSLEQAIILKQTKSGQVPYVSCLVRKKDIKLTPEEAIRQLYLRVLSGRYHYPVNRIQVEYGVNFGREVKRADIVVMDKDRPNTVYMIVELKKPKLKDGKDQLRSYCNATGAPIAVWTNGNQISWYQRKDPNYFEDIPGLPNANQTLADILQIKFTLEDLIANDKLRKEKKSLKALIEEMEDEVLANAGVDVFEELFKLIFTKLYDEWYSGQGNRRNKRSLEFRNTGQTEAALKNKIQDLFDSAKKKWEGVFSDDAKISLTPSHLSVCVSSLENVKLFNSNLDVIDEAFEYLINQSSKGEKGQFFTPRYVIDMCVKMLNPQEDEYMIDTAAGSSGFPVHTIFHVWKQILEDEGIAASHLFSLEDKPPRCREYVEEKVFAIDFDEKAVRVARTLNLIAGDGQTNVLHLNTLDYELWDEVTQQEDWQDIYFEGFKRLKKRRPNKDSYREFSFDVLMANPPFAGDIKEPRMIARYDLAKKSDGKWQSKVGRDILFIERNLDFLKPGGRMGIVLPQGRFNNSSDKYIRDYIAERCRILAVVGLHGNTFKPHTGTKTSVLLVQKWNDDPNVGALCPRKDDYNIFFATMRKSGKDNSGEKIWRKVYVSTDLEDDERYQRLMDGLEAIELNLSYVQANNISVRVDAEFFQKEYIVVAQNLSKKQTPFLGQLAKKIDVGYVGSMVSEYDETGVLLLQTRNIQEFFINTEDCKRITQKFHKQLIKSQIVQGNILIARSGSFGQASIYLDKEVLNSADIIIVEANKSHINPFYLVAFLNSTLGVNQLYRFASGGLQGHVNLTILENLQVPLLLKQFQSFLELVLIKAYKIFQDYKSLYQQAEDLLLLEFNLKHWQPTEETIAVKSFAESYLVSDRLDAEYYQPKYDQAEEVIKGCGFPFQNLGSLIEPIQNGFDYREYTEEGTPYIRVGDVKNGQINFESAVKIPITMADVDKPVGLQVGDILFTRKGSFGNSAVVTELEVNGIISSEIMLVRLTSGSKKEILPEYISLFLNSKFGYLQVERRVHGVAYYSISQPDLANLLIPILPKPHQENIVEKINSSFSLKLKSKQILEIAKTGVERAIETDEATATAWINQQLEALGVELTNHTH